MIPRVAKFEFNEAIWIMPVVRASEILPFRSCRQIRDRTTRIDGTSVAIAITFLRGSGVVLDGSLPMIA